MEITTLTALPLDLLLDAIERHPDLQNQRPKRKYLCTLVKTAHFFNISIAELNSPLRGSWRCSNARHAAMSTLYDLGLSYKTIASFFGRRAHGTALDAVKRTRELFDSNPDFAHALQRLRAALALPPQP